MPPLHDKLYKAGRKAGKTKVSLGEALDKAKYFSEQNKPTVQRLNKKKAMESMSHEERVKFAVKEAVKMLKGGG